MRILIIEDDTATIELYEAILKKYDLDFAMNGKQAINLMSINKYNLIIYDLNLPKVKGYPISGIEIFKWYKESKYYNDTPSIIVSGYINLINGRENTINYYKDIGFKNFILKPIDIINFIEEVKKYE